MLRLIVFFSIALTLSMAARPESVGSPAATLMAQANALLQKNQKAKALPLLEKAFDVSQDPDEIKEICVLILAATPKNYPKRENYLQYLVTHNPDHQDYSLWAKELGDRDFDSGQFEKAEEWYLRSISRSDPRTKTLAEYRIAWVYWNLNRRPEALAKFTDLYVEADSGLKSQILKDISRLWWEIGALPDSSLQILLSWKPQDQQALFTRVLELSPLQSMPGPNQEALLLQFKTDEHLKPYLLQRASRENFVFVKAPCFLFPKILAPEDSFPPELVLSCLKSKDAPSASVLLPYFKQRTEWASSAALHEKWDWAYAELLSSRGSHSEAANVLIGASDFLERSKSYLRFLEAELLRMNSKDFRELYPKIPSEAWDELMQKISSKSLLSRLEAVDSEHWVAFEEQQNQGKPLSKDFLEKKGLVLVGRPDFHSTPEQLNELQKIFAGLSRPPLTPAENSLVASYVTLVHRLDTRLPASFTTDFKKAYDAWLADLDQALINLKTVHKNWEAICRPLFQYLITKNVQRMIAQIDSTRLDPKMKKLAQTFADKKADLKNQLRTKYLGDDPIGASQ